MAATVNDRPMATPNASVDVRFVGGANLPTRYLRMNATWPLAVLAVNDGRLSLRLRGPLQRAGGVPLDAAPADIARVFPTRRMWTKGVGFTDRTGREWYFWTRQVQRVLTVLDEHGYAVTNVAQKAGKVWRGTP